MGNGPSSRRNGRIQHNPVAPPPIPRIVAPPPGYPGNAGPPPYPPNGHHMPYFYPSNYNGAMTPPMGPQFYQQGYMPATNGQYMMSLPPQGFRPVPHPAPPPHAPPPAEAHKANTIRNDVNLKKPTLRLEKDDENPGFYLVAFTFDATVAGSISIFFLARDDQSSLTPLKPHLYRPIRVPFEKGLGQKFRQTPGTGVNLALFDERELSKEGPDGVYPLLIRAETVPKDPTFNVSSRDELPPGAPLPEYIHSQTTHAVIEKKDDGYKVKAVKQTIWVDGVHYDLQEIYGIENSGGGGSFDGNDAGKECVICMSEPRDTTLLPCRHMCMCSECAKVLRFQNNRCPICRTPVERLLEIKIPKNEPMDANGNNYRSSSFKGASASQSSASASQSTRKEGGPLEIKVPKGES